MTPADVAFEAAVNGLRLPRKLGQHPDTGTVVEAGVGRFGPYVKHGDDFRSLTESDNVFTVGLDRALELLSQPKGARSSRAPAAPLRELGAHPEDSQPVVLMSGRYGPYVKHGAINATLPRTVKPESVTLEQALTLIAEKAAKGPAPKRAKMTVKKTTRKTAPKTAKKTTRRTTTKTAGKTRSKPTPTAKKSAKTK